MPDQAHVACSFTWQWVLRYMTLRTSEPINHSAQDALADAPWSQSAQYGLAETKCVQLVVFR